MLANYPKAIRAELVFEGGKVDDPRDPGGRTNQGVIQRVYNGFRQRKGLPIRDVYLMNDAERDEIYKLQFWDAIYGDKLPSGVDMVVFDGAVNSGPVQSVKWLQRALGVAADGHIGQATWNALAANDDNDKLIADILARRMLFLQSLKPWKTYKGGWTSRVNQVKKIGQAWASGSVGPMPIPVSANGGNRKATLAMAKAEPLKALPDATTAIGGTGFTAGTALSTVQEKLEPLAGSSDTVAHIVTALIVAGVVIGLVGGGISYWQRQRAAARADALDLPLPSGAAVSEPDPEPAQ